MMSFRYPVAVLTGLVSAIALLWLMQLLVMGTPAKMVRTDDVRQIEFVRLKREPETRLKERTIPKLPEQAKPLPRPERELMQKTRPVVSALRMPLDLGVTMELTGGPYIGPIGSPVIDRDFMAVSRTPPQYPYSARRRGIEGWVRVSFTVTETGLVRDAVVLESEPRDIFDRAALRAVSKWKFKPRVVDGKPVASQAIQIVDFKLNR